jgi:hypothetical protein
MKLLLHKKRVRQVAAVLIYTAQNLSEERNRRIFDSASATPTRVFQLIREEMKLLRDACGVWSFLVSRMLSSFVEQSIYVFM